MKLKMPTAQFFAGWCSAVGGMLAVEMPIIGVLVILIGILAVAYAQKQVTSPD